MSRYQIKKRTEDDDHAPPPRLSSALPPPEEGQEQAARETEAVRGFPARPSSGTIEGLIHNKKETKDDAWEGGQIAMGSQAAHQQDASNHARVPRPRSSPELRTNEHSSRTI